MFTYLKQNKQDLPQLLNFTWFLNMLSNLFSLFSIHLLKKWSVYFLIIPIA